MPTIPPAMNEMQRANTTKQGLWNCFKYDIPFGILGPCAFRIHEEAHCTPKLPLPLVSTGRYAMDSLYSSGEIRAQHLTQNKQSRKPQKRHYDQH